MAGLGALLLAAACTGGGGASTTPTATATSATATPSSTATATATPTATVEPTATPPASGAPPIVIEPSDALTVREFAPGERLDAEHGVFIADATTGAGELWAVNPDLVPSEFDLRSLQSSPDGRFVTARVVDTGFLADRTTGAGFRWDADASRMVGFPDGEGRALFVSDDEECWFYAVEFRASAAVLLASSRLSEPPERCPQLEGLFSPDGGSLFLQAGARVRGLPATAGLYVVNLASGAIEEAGRLPGSSVTLHARVDGFVTIARETLSSEPQRIAVQRYGWDGMPLGEERVFSTGRPSTSIGTVLLSPDGRSIVWQERLPLGIPLGAGGPEHWPVVGLADLQTGEVRFRAVRASLTNGTGVLDWLADSSEIVVATVDGYAILSASDGALTPLGFGTVSHFEPLPMPAPHDPRLFAFGGRVVDRDGEVVRPVAAAAEAWGPTWGVFTHYAWGATGEVLRFSPDPPNPRPDSAAGTRKQVPL